MQQPEEFLNLLNRIRAGEEEAAEVFVKTYESELRTVVHGRLRNSRLRRLVDSFDVTQSVLAEFFVCSALGAYDFQNQDDVRHYLLAIVRNKVAKLYEKHRAIKRDISRIDPTDIAEHNLPGLDSTPSQQVSLLELLSVFRQHLSEQERYIAQQRADGKAWRELADELSIDADTLRVSFSRAISRVVQQLGLDEV